MARIFISYVKDNLVEVQKLAEILKIYDIDVWLDRDKIKPGYQWKDVIRAGISEGDFFIACFSSEYHSRLKTYMNEELTLAIEELRLRPTNRAWFIPVLLSNCDVPDRDIGGGKTLRSIQWVNLYENWSDGIQSILSVIHPDSSKLFELIQRLKVNSARDRIKASDALGSLGRLAEKAVPYLLEALNDENETVRASAANALGDIGIIDEKVIAAFLFNLQNDRGYPRKHVTKALASFGKPGVISTLIDIVASRSEYYRRAGDAMLCIELKDTNVYIEVMKGLMHQDSLVRSYCLDAALRSYRYHSSHFGTSKLMIFVPDLINLLEKSNPGESDFTAIVQFLTKIGKAANEAVAVLIQKLKSLNDLDWVNRCALIVALGEIGDPAAIPVLTTLLNNRWHCVSINAITALKSIGTVDAFEALGIFNNK